MLYDCLAVHRWASLHLRLDLRPEHRSGFRRTVYSGHTPGTTCWPIEIASESYAQAAMNRYQAYFSDLSAVFAHVGSSQGEQEKAKAIFDETDRLSQALIEKTDRIRGQLGETAY